MILHMTTDIGTLYSWRQTCRYLNQAANRELYERYIIDEAMLRHNLEFSPLHTFLNPENSSNPKAPLVKTLRLDWRFGDKGRFSHPPIFSDHLVQALEMAVPAMSSLECIDHSGTIYQESLEPLLVAKSLQVLGLRTGEFRDRCVTWWNSRRGRALIAKPADELKLNLSVLQKLARLRYLAIENLLPGEGRGLGLALKELHHLRDLEVMAAELKHAYYTVNPHKRGFSPIDELLQEVFPEDTESGFQNTEELSGFPRTLKALHIMDRYSKATALDCYFFKFRAKSPIGLESLVINMDCVHRAKHLSLADVLRAFLSPTVTFLGLPMYDNLDCHPEVHDTARTRAQEVSLLLEVLLPYRETIEEWGFPTASAYQSFNKHPAELDVLWAGPPSYRQISMPKYRSERCLPGPCHLLTVSLFDDFLFPDGRPSSWGRDVRHMSASYFNLSEMMVEDDITSCDASFDALRVLALAPGAPKVERPSDFEYRIARGILTSRLPSLRVLVVGSYTFWFQMPEDRASDEGWAVWNLDDAVDDEEQWAVMRRELDPADWRFFSPAHGSECRHGEWCIAVKRVEEGDRWNGEATTRGLNSKRR